MARMTRVYPASEGLILPMPGGRNLPAEGEVVDLDDLFWARREKDGDITETPPASAAPKVAANTSPASAVSTSNKGE